MALPSLRVGDVGPPVRGPRPAGHHGRPARLGRLRRHVRRSRWSAPSAPSSSAAAAGRRHRRAADLPRPGRRPLAARRPDPDAHARPPAGRRRRGRAAGAAAGARVPVGRVDGLFGSARSARCASSSAASACVRTAWRAADPARRWTSCPGRDRRSRARSCARPTASARRAEPGRPGRRPRPRSRRRPIPAASRATCARPTSPSTWPAGSRVDWPPTGVHVVLTRGGRRPRRARAGRPGQLARRRPGGLAALRVAAERSAGERGGDVLLRADRPRRRLVGRRRAAGDLVQREIVARTDLVDCRSPTRAPGTCCGAP